jgi:hypothetical protein
MDMKERARRTPVCYSRLFVSIRGLFSLLFIRGLSSHEGSDRVIRSSLGYHGRSSC